MIPKILVIDDDPTVVKLIESRVQSAGYTVITARDGKEGLEKAKSEKPDLIILDVLLPEMDGYTLAKEVRKTDEIKATPIIVVTVKEQLQDIFRHEGVYDYLVKPIQTKDLLEKIKNHVGDPSPEV